jgi:hypothetical protein
VSSDGKRLGEIELPEWKEEIHVSENRSIHCGEKECTSSDSSIIEPYYDNETREQLRHLASVLRE